MFRKILSFTTTTGKAFIVTAAISLTLGELLWAGLIYMAVNALFAVMSGGAADMGRLAAAGVILLLAKTCFTILADLTKHCAGFDAVENVRVRLIRKLKKLSLGFFTQERLGELSTVIHKDVDSLESMVGHFLCVMWSDIAVAVIVGGWLFAKSPALGLCMVSLLPFAVASLMSGLRESSAAQTRTNDDLADMVSLFVEYAKGIPLMKAFSENSAFARKLGESVEKFGDSSANQAKVIAGYTGRFGVFFELSSAIMLVVGALFLHSGKVGGDVFLYFVIFSSVFYKPFSKMELYFLEFVKIKDSCRRVTRVLETPSVPNPPNPRDANAFDIDFENVSFSYDSVGEGDFSLRNISFHIPRGQMAALVGPSGSGKTTIANLLLRFWDARDGGVKVGGVDIRCMDYDDLLDHISIVMQNVYLASGSILDNIKLGKRDAAREEVIAASRRAQIHDFIAGLPNGYDTIVGENGVGLSGGQKQRVSIARAFLKDAPIVVLDEITSNVDPVNETKIQRALSELAKNRTVLVIAHHLRTVRSADQIFVFDRGEIAESGRHEDLMARGGIYARLWQSQEQAKGWQIA
ncbi:MAG: ABC transporter ATP-binding protein/permease [Synergistaceae bacterium]|jgi:ATP-binding cassette subfamily B protein|nr:ABC transporter ATP-binding protein/permease [Synergistaceae bacterium]